MTDAKPSPQPPRPGFPATRMRRLRQLPGVRRLVQQTRLAPANLVLPLFVRTSAAAMRSSLTFGNHWLAAM